MDDRAKKAWESAVRLYATPLPGSAPYTNRRPIRVADRFAGFTVERFLAERFPHVRAEDWAAVIDAEWLLRGDAPTALTDTVASGDRLIHLRPDTVEPDVSLDIAWLHDDEDLIALGKPAPLPIHPSGRYNKNALISILRGARPDVKLWVVHRLDSETTGVVLFAKHAAAARSIGAEFRAHRVSKEYIALVDGTPDWDEIICQQPIERALGPSGSRAVGDEGQRAETGFRVISRGETTSLISARPKSGRTHQIRLHIAALGHPISGDRIYGRERATGPVEGSTLRLHAWRLELEHPREGRLALEAPMPRWAEDGGCPD